MAVGGSSARRAQHALSDSQELAAHESKASAARYFSTEHQLAERLGTCEDIKLFMKLPSKFKICTPVGPCNPHRAIVKHEGREDRVYMIRETQCTFDSPKLRLSEAASIKSSKHHFNAIRIEDYVRSTSRNWDL